MRDAPFAALFTIGMVLCFAVLLVVGEIAAVTDWIPHAGTHGRAPSTLGYLGLYAAWTMVSFVAWSLLGGLVVAAVEY